MGGMLIPMYIINRKIQKKPVYFTRCLSLSSTGQNSNISIYMWFFGFIMTHILCRFTSVLSIPEKLHIFYLKCQSTIKELPATNALVKHIMTIILGGRFDDRNYVLTTTSSLFKNQMMFGQSHNMVKHFW